MRQRIFFLLQNLLGGILMLACAAVTNLIPVTATPTSAPTQTPEPTKTVIPTATILEVPYKIEKGPGISIKSGGVYFAPIRAYDLGNLDNNSAYLISPDEKVEIGFFTYPLSGDSDILTIYKDWAKSLNEDFPDAEISDPTESPVNGIKAVHGKIEGTKDDEVVFGKISVFAPEESKLIYFYLITYGEDRWALEGEQVHKITMNSLKIFEIKPLTNCPQPPNSDYGFSEKNPIKIGGGNTSGWYRSNDYLAALLDEKERVVPYISVGSVSNEEADLEVFMLRSSNDKYKKVYFDISHYEEVKTIKGYQCSAPFPGEPEEDPNSKT